MADKEKEKIWVDTTRTSDKTVAQEFHLDQLKWLREAITDRIVYMRQIELYVILGNVGVWSFLLAHPNEAMRIAWLAPVFLNAICLLKRFSLEMEMLTVADYVRSAEHSFVLSSRLRGWESSSESGTFRKVFLTFNIAFWLVMLIVSGGIAFLEVTDRSASPGLSWWFSPNLPSPPPSALWN